MANLKDILPGNLPGKYYVDSQCIHCRKCVDSAEDFFRATEDYPVKTNVRFNYCYVFRQPTTPEEVQICETALMECPLSAIGNDGLEARTG